jgi:hypothetical protein
VSDETPIFRFVDLDPHERAVLRALAARLGLSESDAVRLALREMAEHLGLEDAASVRVPEAGK